MRTLGALRYHYEDAKCLCDVIVYTIVYYVNYTLVVITRAHNILTGA